MNVNVNGINPVINDDIFFYNIYANLRIIWFINLMVSLEKLWTLK